MWICENSLIKLFVVAIIFPNVSVVNAVIRFQNIIFQPRGGLNAVQVSETCVHITITWTTHALFLSVGLNAHIDWNPCIKPLNNENLFFKICCFQWRMANVNTEETFCTSDCLSVLILLSSTVRRLYPLDWWQITEAPLVSVNTANGYITANAS